MKVLGLFALSFILAGCAEKWPHGPWDGYIYAGNKGELNLMRQGTYERLDLCMRTMQVRTSKNGYPYYCGYDCETLKDGTVDCEKIIGVPDLE